MLAIKTERLTKVFGRLVAVSSLNLEVEAGEIFGLLGPNGAGKTTAIRMICGLLPPTSGRVEVYGRDPFKEPQAVKMMLGYMPQRFSLYDDLTVWENLDFYGSVYGLSRGERERRIEELLKLVELKGFEGHLAGKLSGGMKQRLALAAALIHRPKLLVLDEPTAGVDPPLRRALWSLFRRLNREGVTILMTTHYMDEAENCDRLGLMSRGVLAAVDTPKGLKRRLHGGDVVEVIVEGSAEEVARRLAELSFVKRASVEGGGRVRAVVDDAERSMPTLISSLERMGVHVKLASQVSISLEDAFIGLAGG